ncbi:MAG TPA: hypothetical protein VFB14_28175 [Bryobacteraceae bacterium]|jgi:hypothetical protein|nr:hypothetical protein [Bryobacteraceae bacterium]
MTTRLIDRAVERPTPSAKVVSISKEDSAELEALKGSLIAEHQPATPTESILVNEMAENHWRIRRARRIEAALVNSGEFNMAHLNAVHRLITGADRAFHRALNALRRMQKDRGFVPQKQQSGSRSESASALGFVPQKAASAEAGWMSSFLSESFVENLLNGLELPETDPILADRSL